MSAIFPESDLLIVLGIIIGVLLFYTKLMSVSPLTPDTFFLFMLPPIVLDAGYFMPNRLFFDNLGTILLFAVVGTIFNTLTIGVSLWAVGLTGLYGIELEVLEAFLFSSLISAVDPVAVLAVFEEIHVNEMLYIVVFGESLLNDAVTVVLYHMFEAYTEMGAHNIVYTDVLLGFASFFVVALGGTAIGVIWGFLTGFVTRFTKHVRVIEPIMVFVMSYLSYLNAEMFHLSGILAIVFCGMTAKNYVEANVSSKSSTTIKYTMKMLSSSSETIIFMFLGLSTVNDGHNWNTWFVVFTILFCSVYRAIGVVLLTALANHFRLHKLNRVEEFVMAYGGLRGAVAFALALTISENVVKHKAMFVTTTIAMVYFTCFVQGITIKPLVRILRVKKSEKRKVTMNERIHERFMDHMMAGIEEIAGHHGNHHLRDKFKYYDNKYIRRFMVREHKAQEPKILETFSKLASRDAKEFLSQNGSFVPRMTPETSLGVIFRNYTQSNLNVCSVSSGDISRNDTSVLDMAEFDYSPSARDINDAKLHHILSDAMFKTPRRHRRFSRTVVNEPDIHPPFKHMMRMQIRQMMSEQYRRQNKNFKKKGSSTTHLAVNDNRDRSPPKTSSGEVSPNCFANPAMEDDGGITFTAKGNNNHSRSNSHSPARKRKNGDLNGNRSPALTPRTAIELQLPWKRDGSGEINDDLPLRQQEFPAWADNKDYNAYISLTTTFLSRLPEEKPRTIYQVFTDVVRKPTSASTSSSEPSTVAASDIAQDLAQDDQAIEMEGSVSETTPKVNGSSTTQL